MKVLFALIGAVLGAAMGGFGVSLLGLVLGVVAAVVVEKNSSKDPNKGDAAGAPRPAVPTTPRTNTLEERVIALEQQVSTLKREVASLSARLSSAATTGAAPGAAAVANQIVVAPSVTPAVSAPPPIPPLTPPLTPAEPQPAPALARQDVLVARTAVPVAPATPATPPAQDVAPAQDAGPTLLPELTPLPVSAPVSEDVPAAPVVGSLAAAPAPATTLASSPAATEAPSNAPPKAPAPRPAVAPPPPAVPLKDRLPPVVRDWIFGGNTIVKVGVLVLFLGLAFLLRYAAERVTVPPELRYAAVALLGIGLLGLGWRLRNRKDAAGGTGYGLILQGAGIGVLYLTTLASLKLNALIPPEAAFVFLFAVSVLSAVLAVVQNAPWLAYVAVAEGFAAPVLVSSGGGHHHVLFSYMLLLDIGVFLIAWFKAWRPLNVVAFVGTFTLAGGWASNSYNESLYAGVQVYLLLFFVLFTLIGVLFARRALASGSPADERDPLAQRAAQALAQVGRVDSALVFGVPLVAYGLQYLLVKDWAFGPAWAAIGYAMFYLLLGGVTMRRGGPRYGLLGEAYVIVSVIFGTLSIPLALEGVWTGATWAIEAAGMYWLGLRQQRTYARVFALLVLAGAALRTAVSMGIDEGAGTPLLTGSVLALAMLAGGALAIFANCRRAWRDVSAAAWESAGEAGTFLIGLGALTAIGWTVLTPAWACVATSLLALGVSLTPAAWRSPVLPWAVAGLQGLALAGFGASLHVVDGEAMLSSGWQGLVSAVMIGASLLATAVLAVPADLRRRLLSESDEAPPAWPLGATLGFLAGLSAISLSVLFVLPADQAARVWPWLGVLALWLGLRLRQDALAVAGAGLQVAAGIACWSYGPLLWSAETTGLTLWTPLCLALAAWFSGDRVRLASLRRGMPAWWQSPAPQWACLVWALVWWAQVLPPEVLRPLLRNQTADSAGWWAATLCGWVLLTSLLLTGLALWRQWKVAGQSTAGTVPMLMCVALMGLGVAGDAPHAHLGWLLWPLALVWHGVLLRTQPRWLPAQGLGPLHVLGFWLFVTVGAREGQYLMSQLGEADSAWSALGWVAVPAAVLALISRPVLAKRWPLSEWRDTYMGWASGPVAFYLLLWVWVSNALAGEAAPLPYVPLLNPLELGHGLVLLSLLMWFREWPEAMRAGEPRQALFATAGITAFALYTGMLLRACHHLAGVPWDAGALFDSRLTQATLSVAWAILGVGLMVLGHKKVHRVVWAAGAGLLALVVAKLFFIELADHGGLYRIVSFIVVGLLLLAVGYFAPVPPRQKDEAAEADKSEAEAGKPEEGDGAAVTAGEGTTT